MGQLDIVLFQYCFKRKYIFNDSLVLLVGQLVRYFNNTMADTYKSMNNEVGENEM